MENGEVVPNGWVKIKSKSHPSKYYYHNSEKKLSFWKIEHVKAYEEKKRKETKISADSKTISKKNLAQRRLKKLQSALALEVKEDKEYFSKKKKQNSSSDLLKSNESQGLAKNIANKRLNSFTKKLQQSPRKQSQDAQKADIQKEPETDVLREEEASKNFVETCNNKNQQNEYSVERMDIEEDVQSTEADSKELMEWEPIDENLLLEEVSNVRSKEATAINSTVNFDLLCRENSISSDRFYILIDTNIFLSNLEFVKKIKGKFFKDIGHGYIYVPYIVLCELDKLKLRGEKIAKLARTAINFIQDCFAAKDSFLNGQSAIENEKTIISIESGDDLIINCALQVNENFRKIIILSNDKNLRNKSFVNGIEAFSSDMLNYTNFNETNGITFN